MGVFSKCGFYDWKMFTLGKDGTNEEVNKIVNISDNVKLGSKLKHKKIYNLKPVQGRFIVHPQKSKSLQIHEIYMDSLNASEKYKRVPHFTDAIEDIKKYASNGINCAYLMGVFERDTGSFSQGYKRPQASPMALTCRKTPCKMLGGPTNF